MGVLMAGEMGLTIPTPQVTVGPEWAENISSDLEIIESHDHLSTGARLNSQGMDFVGNLELTQVSTYADPYMGGWSAMYMTPVVTDGSVSIPALSMLVDESTNDLYYKNLSGDIVRLTNGSSIATPPSSVEMNWPTLFCNVSTTINPSDSYICYEMDVSAGSTAYTLTLPLAASVPDGHIYIVRQKPASDSSASVNTTNNYLYVDTHDTTDSISCYGVTSNTNGSNKRVVMPRYEAWAVFIKKDSTHWIAWVSSIEATSKSVGLVRLTANLSGTGSNPRVVGTGSIVTISKDDGTESSSIRASTGTGNLGIFGSENGDYGGGIVICTNDQDGDPATLVSDDDIKLISAHSIKLVTNNSGRTEVDDDLYVGNDVSIVNDLSVQGDTVSGELHVHSGELTVSGGTLTSSCAATFSSTMSIGGTLSVSGDSTFSTAWYVGSPDSYYLQAVKSTSSKILVTVSGYNALKFEDHSTYSTLTQYFRPGYDFPNITSNTSYLKMTFGASNTFELTGVTWSPGSGGYRPRYLLANVDGVACKILLEVP